MSINAMYFLLIRRQRRPCLLAIDDGLSLTKLPYSTLRWVLLILGWVTVFRWVMSILPWYVTRRAGKLGQLSLASLLVTKSSTSSIGWGKCGIVTFAV